jgi:hypothetical protein
MKRLIFDFAACLFRDCATNQRAVGDRAEPLRGDNCYALMLGAWSGPFPSGSPEVHQPPDTFQLLSPAEGHYHHYVRPGLPALGGRGWTGWKRFSNDSVEVFWSTGFAGVRLVFTRLGDTLSGTATSFWDVIGPQEPIATATAIRIACPDSATTHG